MAKNYDPAMHTAEHILNQTMVRMFNTGRAFRAHIEKRKSKCDYVFNRNLSEDEITKLENTVNQIINSGLPVIEEFHKKEDATRFINLDRLPEDAGDTIRIIKIGEYDLCPCSGFHVANTKEIGTFRIVSASFEENILRIRYKLIETNLV